MRPQVVLTLGGAVVAELLGAVVADPVGAVVAGDKVLGVVVVVEPPLLLLHALLTRAIPASMAAAVTRRMGGIGALP